MGQGVPRKNYFTHGELFLITVIKEFTLLIEEIIEFNIGYLVRYFHQMIFQLRNVIFMIKGASDASTVAGSNNDPGTWSYQFNNPSSINLDQYGYLYIVDTSNNRIQKWYPGSAYGTTMISSTTMNAPIGMSLDLYGNYYIADTSNHRILSFGLLCRKSNFNNEILIENFSSKLQQQQQQHHHQVKL